MCQILWTVVIGLANQSNSMPSRSTGGFFDNAVAANSVKIKILQSTHFRTNTAQAAMMMMTTLIVLLFTIALVPTAALATKIDLLLGTLDESSPNHHRLYLYSFDPQSPPSVHAHTSALANTTTLFQMEVQSVFYIQVFGPSADRPWEWIITSGQQFLRVAQQSLLLTVDSVLPPLPILDPAFSYFDTLYDHVIHMTAQNTDYVFSCPQISSGTETNTYIIILQIYINATSTIYDDNGIPINPLPIYNNTLISDNGGLSELMIFGHFAVDQNKQLIFIAVCNLDTNINYIHVFDVSQYTVAEPIRIINYTYPSPKYNNLVSLQYAEKQNKLLGVNYIMTTPRGPVESFIVQITSIDLITGNATLLVQLPQLTPAYDFTYTYDDETGIFYFLCQGGTIDKLTSWYITANTLTGNTSKIVQLNLSDIVFTISLSQSESITKSAALLQ